MLNNVGPSREELIKQAKAKGYTDAQIQKMSDNQLIMLLSNTQIKTSGNTYGFNFFPTSNSTNKTDNIWGNSAINNVGFTFQRTITNSPKKIPKNTTKNEKLTSGEIKNQAITSIQDNVLNGMDLYIAQNKKQGDISKFYNSVKELFNTEFAGTRVYRVLSAEQLGGELLEKANKGELSQKDYLEAKLNLAVQLLPKGGDKQDADYLRKALADLTPEKLNETIDLIKTCNDEQYNNYWTEYTKNLIKEQKYNSTKSPNDFSYLNVNIQKPGSVQSFIQSEDSYKKLEFEQVYQYERGVQYDPQAIVDYSEKEANMQMLLGVSNKINDIKNVIDKPTIVVEGNNKGQVSDNISQASEKELEKSLIIGLKKLYGDDETKINIELKRIYGNNNVQFIKLKKEEKEGVEEKFNLNDEKIDFGEYGNKMKSHSLVTISNNLQAELDSRLKNALGDKTLEQYKSETTEAYNKAYGEKNGNQLANAFAESQKEGVQTIKGIVQGAGMVVMIAGQFIPVGGQIATAMVMGGMATSTLGGVAVQLTEDVTKEGGVTKEDKDAIIKELTTSVALMASGMGIGKISSAVYAQMVLKNCPKLLAFASEVGIDATMSLVSDSIITGQIDLSGEGRSQLISILTGLAKSKGNLKKFLNSKMSHETPPNKLLDKTSTNMQDEITLKPPMQISEELQGLIKNTPEKMKLIEESYNEFWRLKKNKVLHSSDPNITVGSLLHGTSYDYKKIRSILKDGIVSGDIQYNDKIFYKEDGETFGCADFFVNPENRNIKDYFNWASQKIKKGNLAKPKPESRYLTANTHVTFVVGSEYLEKDLKILNKNSATPANLEQSELNGVIIGFPGYENQAAVLVGVPSNYIEKIIVGNKVTADQINEINQLVKEFGLDAKIFNMDGKLLSSNETKVIENNK